MQSALTMKRGLLDRFYTVVATGGYCGYSRIIPGTVGSLVGLLLYLPFTVSPVLFRVAVTAIVFFLGVLAASRVEDLWKIKDPKPVVIDEIVGMWIALLFVPHQVTYFLGAFILFRVFDIVKPFPAGQAEHLEGGWGIMLDDVVAGIYAGAIFYGVQGLQMFLAN